MKCRTIQGKNNTGSIIVGCGSEPCRCAEIDAEMDRVFGTSREQRMAELEAELAEDNWPDVPAEDGLTPMERWLS